MSGPRAGVRILIVDLSALPRGAELVAALEGLGSEVSVVTLRDAAECLERLRQPEIDLVVLDLRSVQEPPGIVSELAAAGPPILVVLEATREAAALEMFRAGAADWIADGPQLAQVLAHAALEQIRRWRALRERQQLEKNLGDLEFYNQNIIHNMNSALLVLDSEGLINFSNHLAERILGAAAGALTGRSAFDWFSEQPRERVPLWRTLQEGASLRGVETWLSRSDGVRVPIGMSCAPTSGGDGRTGGAIVLFQDLSGIKRLQSQVLQSEKMASIGQLAAGVAHEINNPMGFIHANLAQMAEYVTDLSRVWEFTGRLRKAVAGGNPEEIQAAVSSLDSVTEALDPDFLLADLAKAVRESQEGSERIRHIVADLRVFSHQSGDPVAADLNQCLDSTANIVWTIMKHSARLEKNYGELPLVICQPAQLKQVFMNLLVNAYQAIEARTRGAGDPGPGHGDPEELGVISLETRVDGNSVVVTVEDNGTGIPAEHLERIFEPFFTTKDVGEGTGLGLSTSYDIVRRHGGSLCVESEPGRGSRFELRLPLDATLQRPAEDSRS